ncbi:PepSY-associated TM helix domain-containing protein [Bacillus sp. V2I10]|uniref:PepSY-associated TM helix domain-containing protein n=1 Tax=Bacillus sp. V2I10 TaxID=3042276 RepID=UPI002780A7F9|nr:PepSY-associated TM helix domain-containing protein [Bacillus sp. V2I10]MDQ0862143.1 putative iron-regulated membrane protein [Bacillus sp. V2I10]
MSKTLSLYQFSRKVHKWAGLILSVVFMFIAVTGLLLVYYIPLGLGTDLKTGVKADPSKSIPIEKVISITTSQELPGIKSVEDIFRIELSPGSNVFRVRLENNQEVQIDASTGKVLSTKPDYSGFLISLHDGSTFGNLYRYSALTMAGLSLILLSFSGYYMIGFPLYKRLMARKNAKNLEI